MPREPQGKVGRARSRRWTALEAIAWIAFRTLQAADVAAKLKSSIPKARSARPFALLAAAAAIDRARTATADTSRSPGVRVREAMRMLGSARRNGTLPEVAPGVYSSAAVRRLFPSSEGRGKGPAKRVNGARFRSGVHRLAFYFLDNAPAEGSGKKAYEWCCDAGICVHRRDFIKLRGAALEWAVDELNRRCKYGLGFATDATKLPMTPHEIAERSDRLKGWRRIFEPRV